MTAGDSVAYSAAFIRATGARGKRRGVIVDRPDILGGLDASRFVVVAWTDGDVTPVLRANLSRVRGAGFVAR